MCNEQLVLLQRSLTRSVTNVRRGSVADPSKKFTAICVCACLLLRATFLRCFEGTQIETLPLCAWFNPDPQTRKQSKHVTDQIPTMASLLSRPDKTNLKLGGWKPHAPVHLRTTGFQGCDSNKSHTPDPFPRVLSVRAGTTRYIKKQRKMAGLGLPAVAKRLASTIKFRV